MSIFDRFGNLIFDLRAGVSGCDHLRLEAIDLSLADLPRASFVGADLYWVTFFEADLSSGDFSHAIMRGVDFKGADCRHANFSGARFLPDALGLPCELQATNMAHARLDGVEIVSATYDKATRWPSSFDPGQHNGLRQVIGI
jgi:uncharacterized protein YjbI with pentapeptide repeats